MEIQAVFDGQIFALQRHGGISLYFSRLVAGLASHGVRPRILAPIHVNYEVAQMPRDLAKGLFVGGGTRALTTARKAGRIASWLQMRLASADLHHETYYSTYRLARRTIPIVTTVHDMIHEKFPQYFQGDATASRKLASIRRADRVICVSESTRIDLLSFYPWAQDKTVVVLHGVDQLSSLPQRADIGEPYILFVGGRAHYKNFAGLLEALARSPRLSRDFRLLCVGEPFTEGEMALIAGLGLTDRVTSSQASRTALNELYAGARLLAYPSIYEGFGFPPLEAMAAGCPAVCIRTSSLPEVCGSAAYYAEPANIESLTEAIEAVAYADDNMRSAIVAAGRKHAAGFAWSECARLTAGVYGNVVGT